MVKLLTRRGAAVAALCIMVAGPVRAQPGQAETRRLAQEAVQAALSEPAVQNALEAARARSGVRKSMRNRVVKTGSKHLDQATLHARLRAAGWDGLKAKEIDFFYS